MLDLKDVPLLAKLISHTKSRKMWVMCRHNDKEYYRKMTRRGRHGDDMSKHTVDSI